MQERPRIVRPHGTMRQPGLGRRALRARGEGRASRGWAASALAGAALLGGMALVVRAQARGAERRHPPVGRFMTVDGVRLHYLERGQGSPMVLFHGNGSLIDEFLVSGLVDRLARNHRVIVFDRPGFGYSSRPRSRIWTPEAQAELFARALDRLQVGSATVYGHSWGTLVAVALALVRPSRVAGVVLGSGYYYPTGRMDVPLASSPAIPVFGDILRYTVAPVVSGLLLPRIYDKIFGPAPVPRRFEEQFPHELLLRPAHLRAAGADTALMIPAAMKLQHRYQELDMPVTILAGEGDRIVEPDRHSLRLHRDIPRSTYAELPGVGHMIHHSALDEVVDAIETMAAVRPPVATSARTTGFESHRPSGIVS
jgi:pimeloyl-ACP methyl ester carboxylesterase